MTASSVSFVTMVANTEAQLIGANKRRKRLRFYININTPFYVRPDAIGNVAGGLGMAQFSPAIEITLEDHGDIVCGSWFGFSTGAPIVGILETID